MTTHSAAPPRLRALTLIFDAVRGALIGLAELVPGISGGTVALITGVYERLIDSASHVVHAAKRLVFGPDRRARAARELREVELALVVPVIIGMVAILLTLAGPVEALVSGNPELARGLFFGLVAASIVVPLRLLPPARSRLRGRINGGVVFAIAAIVAYLLIGSAGAAAMVDPPLWFVFLAAAIAVCALVVPGVSGSFFLLAVGLYSPTLRAVDERNLTFIGVFALGAFVGLVTIVQLMKWMLDRHRRLTLFAMAGLMLGSLGALWPWQSVPSDERGAGGLVAPYEPIAGPILLAVLGATVVLALIFVENGIQRRNAVLGSGAPQMQPT